MHNTNDWESRWFNSNITNEISARAVHFQFYVTAIRFHWYFCQMHLSTNCNWKGKTAKQLDDTQLSVLPLINMQLFCIIISFVIALIVNKCLKLSRSMLFVAVFTHHPRICDEAFKVNLKTNMKKDIITNMMQPKMSTQRYSFNLINWKRTQFYTLSL